MTSNTRKLRVFLCHTPDDIHLVHEFYRGLRPHLWIDLLLDSEKIFQAKYWEGKTFRNSHVVIVFLSKTAINDDNFRYTLDSVLEASQNNTGESILVVVLKLDGCEIPEQLLRYQCFNYVGNEEDRLKIQENLLDLLMAYERRLMKDDLSPIFNDLVPESHQLRVLICCASQDRPAATQISDFLLCEEWIFAWLIDEDSYQVKAYQKKVEFAIWETDVIVVLLSKDSVSKEGYKEKGFYSPIANAQRKDDGSILLIPVRLDDFMPPPRFQSWHWLDYFVNGAQDKLIEGLRLFAGKLKIKLPVDIEQGDGQIVYQTNLGLSESQEDLELYNFVKIPFKSLEAPSYTYWISQYPVTVAQYEKFLRSDDYLHKSYWSNYPKYDETCHYVGEWEDEGYKWIRQRRQYFASYPSQMSRVQPHNWKDPYLTLAGLNNPLIGIIWYEAAAYCKWLSMHWKEIPGFVHYSNLKTNVDIHFRLPLETEWLLAADFCQTKPPGDYPGGRSPTGVFYIPHFLHEWLANYRLPDIMAMCLGEMYVDKNLAEMARQSYRHSCPPTLCRDNFGFRVVAVSAKEG